MLAHTPPRVKSNNTRLLSERELFFSTKADRCGVDITALRPTVGSTNHGGILIGSFFRDEELKACKHGEAYYQADWNLYKCRLTRRKAEQLIPLSPEQREKRAMS